MASIDDTKVDFIALLPVDLTEKILGYLVPGGRRHKSPETVMKCCLVSKTWKHVVERSGVWSGIAKSHYLTIPKYMRTEDSLPPRSRLIQIRQRAEMENLFQELVKEEFEFDASMLEEDEDEMQPDLLQMEYGGGMIATGA